MPTASEAKSSLSPRHLGARALQTYSINGMQASQRVHSWAPPSWPPGNRVPLTLASMPTPARYRMKLLLIKPRLRSRSGPAIAAAAAAESVLMERGWMMVFVLDALGKGREDVPLIRDPDG
jgi:hypothetical protein